MSRANAIPQENCHLLLKYGYILENEHGFRVWMHKNKQVITNKTRMKRKGKNYAYKFDYPTWLVVGRLSLKDRILNRVYYYWGKLWN